MGESVQENTTAKQKATEAERKAGQEKSGFVQLQIHRCRPGCLPAVPRPPPVPARLPAAGSPRRAVLEELQPPQAPSLTHLPELPHACLHSKSLSRGVHAENRRADCPCERWVTCAYQGAMTFTAYLSEGSLGRTQSSEGP